MQKNKQQTVEIEQVFSYLDQTNLVQGIVETKSEKITLSFKKISPTSTQVISYIKLIEKKEYEAVQVSLEDIMLPEYCKDFKDYYVSFIDNLVYLDEETDEKKELFLKMKEDALACLSLYEKIYSKILQPLILKYRGK